VFIRHFNSTKNLISLAGFSTILLRIFDDSVVDKRTCSEQSDEYFSKRKPN